MIDTRSVCLCHPSRLIMEVLCTQVIEPIIHVWLLGVFGDANQMNKIVNQNFLDKFINDRLWNSSLFTSFLRILVGLVLSNLLYRFW